MDMGNWGDMNRTIFKIMEWGFGPRILNNVPLFPSLIKFFWLHIDTLDYITI
jgi:hypothetical protein